VNPKTEKGGERKGSGYGPSWAQEGSGSGKNLGPAGEVGIRNYRPLLKGIRRAWGKECPHRGEPLHRRPAGKKRILSAMEGGHEETRVIESPKRMKTREEKRLHQKAWALKRADTKAGRHSQVVKSRQNLNNEKMAQSMDPKPARGNQRDQII